MYAHKQADELQGIWYYRVLAWSSCLAKFFHISNVPISMGMGKVAKGAGGQNRGFKAVLFKRLFLTQGDHIVRGHCMSVVPCVICRCVLTYRQPIRT